MLAQDKLCAYTVFVAAIVLHETELNMLQIFTQTLQNACYTVFAVEQRGALCYADVDGGCVYSRDGQETLCVQGDWHGGEISYGLQTAYYAREDANEGKLQIELDDSTELCYEDSAEGWDAAALALLTRFDKM